MFATTLDPHLLFRPVDPGEVAADRDRTRAELALVRGDLSEFGGLADRTRLARFLARSAWASTLLGDLDEALEAFDEALRWYAEDERSQAILLTRLRRAHALLCAGRAEAARVELDDASSQGELRTDPRRWRAYGELASVVGAGIALALGERERAVGLLGEARAVRADRPRSDDVMGVDVAWEALRSEGASR